MSGLRDYYEMNRALEAQQAQTLETELLDALRELQKQLHAHIRLDVKKHYSLMVADAIASKAIARAEGKA